MKTLACLASLVLIVDASAAQDPAAGKKKYVDVHLHLQPGKGRRGPDFEPAAKLLIEKMDRLGVAKALVMPPPGITTGAGSKYSDEALLDVIKNHADRFVLVAGGASLMPMIHGADAAKVTQDVEAQFDKKAEALLKAGAKAFGEITAMHLSLHDEHPYIAPPPDHPLLKRLADIAAKNDVPIDWHMEAIPEEIALPKGINKRSSHNPERLPATIPAFEKLLDHNPKARIVWQHIGWDNTGGMTVDLLRRLLKGHANLFMALRVEDRPLTLGGDPMPNRVVDRDGKVKPDWLELIKEFPDRFVIGTDEFIGPPSARQMPKSFESTWAIVDQLPADVADKVGRANATAIYGLK